MVEIFSLIKFFGGCGTLLLLALGILLAIPESRLRAILVKFIGWSVVVLCLLYTINPLDALPEGLLGPIGMIDDVAAIVIAVGAGQAALKARPKLPAK